MIHHPLGHPLLDALNIALHVFQRIRRHLVDYIGRVRFPSFFQDDLHDLAFNVFTALPVRVVSGGQAIEEDVCLGSQHQNQIEPMLGEHVANVKINDNAPRTGVVIIAQVIVIRLSFQQRFQDRQQLVLVQNERIKSFVPSFVALVFLN